MFLRVITDKKEVTFNCRRVSISREFAGKTPEKPCVYILIDDNKSEQYFEFECNDKLEIIYMNEEGKTVDRKRF